jgi:hypothetical protein
MKSLKKDDSIIDSRESIDKQSEPGKEEEVRTTDMDYEKLYDISTRIFNRILACPDDDFEDDLPVETDLRAMSKFKV